LQRLLELLLLTAIAAIKKENVEFGEAEHM
jgi:hypothetical protein